MLTASEKKYLCVSIGFLLLGAGLKTYRHSQVRLGPWAGEKPTSVGTDLVKARVAFPAFVTLTDFSGRPVWLPQSEPALCLRNPWLPTPCGATLSTAWQGQGWPSEFRDSTLASNQDGELSEAEVAFSVASAQTPHPLGQSPGDSAQEATPPVPVDRYTAAEGYVAFADNAPHRHRRGTASDPKPASGKKSDFTGTVSLNRADAPALTAIRGIGVKTAEAILAYRAEHGRFHNVEDLLMVKGIGEKKLERIRPYLIL